MQFINGPFKITLAASEGGDVKKHIEGVHENIRNLDKDLFSSYGLLQVILF